MIRVLRLPTAALLLVLPSDGPTDGLVISPKDDAELLRLAERIKELGTDDAATLSNIGFNLYWIRLEFDAGVEMVERAIQANPNYAGAYNLRGNFRVWDGESDTAIADYEKAMRLSPRDALTTMR